MYAYGTKHVHVHIDHIPTNLPETKGGTNFLKKWDIWSESGTFLPIC